jgi:protein phosphatase
LALRGGGPDNVTVVVADVVDYGMGQTQPILAGAVSGDDDAPPPNTAAGRASAFNPRRAEPTKRPATEPPPPERKPRSRRRILFVALLLVLLVIVGLAVGRLVIRSNYYVAEYDGAVYIMRGVQGSFLGMPLQQPFRLGCLDTRNELRIIGVDDQRGDCQLLEVADLRESERAQVTAGLPAGSVDDAMAQLRELGRSSLLPVCLPPAPATTTTTTPPPPPPPAPTPEPSGEPTESANPEVPTTVTSPEAPTTVTSPAPPAPPPTTPPAPTGTSLSPPPQEPGTNCRAAS